MKKIPDVVDFIEGRGNAGDGFDGMRRERAHRRDLDRLKHLPLNISSDGGDTGAKGMTYSGETLKPVDNAMDNYLNPLFEAEVRGALQEVEAMRLAGTLMPFREGQHIGMLPRRVPPKKLTKAQYAKLHNERMTREREAMLQLRAKNDAEIALLTGRRF